MSSATDDAGQPGFSPSRRAITLCTPSAAITIGASKRRPSRASSATPDVGRRRLHDVDAGRSARRRLRTRESTRAARRTRRGESSTPPARPTRSIVDSPPGPSRCSRATVCVAIRASSPLEIRKPLQHPEADAAAARLVSGKVRPVEQADRYAGPRERPRGGRAGGPAPTTMTIDPWIAIADCRLADSSICKCSAVCRSAAAALRAVPRLIRFASS